MDTEFQLQREGDKITLTVSVPKEEIKRKEQQLLASISRELSIPGFRPGKAPRHLVLSHYGQREFERDLLEALIEEGLKEALDRARLSPVTTPQVREVDFQPDKQLAFQASFEVLPEPEIPDGFSLPLEEPPPAEVSEEELNEVLADLRRQAAVLEPKGAPAEGGDVVRIRQGERVWEAEIDPQRTIGKQLVGVEAGTSVVLRDEEGHAEEFEVLEVYRLLVPDEEETAAYFGEESWQALRERVRAQLLAQKEAERKHALRLAALDALADQLQLEPPPGLLKQATDEEMQALGIKPELRGEVEQAVRRRLRREILAQRIAEQKGLLPTQGEVEQAAREAGADPDRMWGRLVFRRAADWIIEHAKRRPA
jgi:trigger factor